MVDSAAEQFGEGPVLALEPLGSRVTVREKEGDARLYPRHIYEKTMVSGTEACEEKAKAIFTGVALRRELAAGQCGGGASFGRGYGTWQALCGDERRGSAAGDLSLFPSVPDEVFGDDLPRACAGPGGREERVADQQRCGAVHSVLLAER